MEIQTMQKVNTGGTTTLMIRS